MTKTFSQELEEVKAQEQAEIAKILEDPNVSEEIKSMVRVKNPDPSNYRRYFSIEQMMEVEDPQLRDKNMPSPEQELDEKEKRIGVEDVLGDLSDRERLILEKVFWEGKSQVEIEQETGIPQYTISRLLSKAISKLSTNPLLKQFWDSQFDRTYPKGSHKQQGAE